MKGFVAYSRADSEKVAKLMTHLKALQREGVIEVWHDRQLTPGEAWDLRIRTQLAAADIVILCVSPDLLVNDYVQDVEIPAAIRRHNGGNVTVIPVIFRECAWQHSALGAFQGLPDDDLTVHDYEREDKLDKVLKAITDGVREAAQLLRRHDEYDLLDLVFRGEVDPRLIERLTGTIPEPFPPLDHWPLFCLFGERILATRTVIDREGGKGTFEQAIQGSTHKDDPPDFRATTKHNEIEGEAHELAVEWLVDGHEYGVQFPGDERWAPTYPGLIFRLHGKWAGWNDLLGRKLGDDGYEENVHTDEVERRAFRSYVERAAMILRLVRTGQEAREWSDLQMLAFLKRQASELANFDDCVDQVQPTDGEERMPAFGMWRDRDELADVGAYVREVREGRPLAD